MATSEPRYTNGRIRVRPEQIEYLDGLLHRIWLEVSSIRKDMKLVDDSALVTEVNRELRLISSIQEEVRRTRDEMEERS